MDYQMFKLLWKNHLVTLFYKLKIKFVNSNIENNLQVEKQSPWLKHGRFNVHIINLDCQKCWKRWSKHLYYVNQ